MGFYNDLEKRLDSDKLKETNSRLLFANHKHRFTKVAFDMFQDKNGTGIWKIRKIDGKDFIVRAKNDDLENTELDVSTDKTGQNVTVAFNKFPIMRFAGKDYGFNDKDVHLFTQTLREKLRSPEFVKSLIASLAPEVRKNILKEASSLDMTQDVQIDSSMVAWDDSQELLKTTMAQIQDVQILNNLENQQRNLLHQQRNLLQKKKQTTLDTVQKTVKDKEKDLTDTKKQMQDIKNTPAEQLGG